MRPVEQVGAWLFRVARNRITDLFRKKRPESLRIEPASSGEEGEELKAHLVHVREAAWGPGDGKTSCRRPTPVPEAAYAWLILMEELDAALEELPEEQREAFVAHEFDGRSFKEMAAETIVSVNTLLSRKHYAVLHLRRRLQAVHDEIMKTRG